MSRIEFAKKNIKYGYIGTVLNLLLKFVSRTVFIYALGATYLGVNGLYTNILSVLSFAELGIGTAMNYSLYKPIAEHDKEKIKSLMSLYKTAYRWIAIIVAVLGLGIIPFLQFVIKDPGSISDTELIVYYLIFLFNTVSSYFVSYKYSLANAEQKNYIQTNIRTVSTVMVVLAQILVLLFLQNFLIYLLVGAFIELLEKVYANYYLNKKYPMLLEKNVRKLDSEEVEPIKTNIKALVFHKIGEISVYQSDNIVISSFINITVVGLVSNYNLLISSVTQLINIIFNSLISSFGNLIATESIEKQLRLFKVYRFVAFWVFGFSSIAFIILLSPFVELWIGSEMVINQLVIYLIIIDFYARGHRIVVNNFKIAAGVFAADKYVAILQAVVNLVISIILVQYIGLAGIFIGTVIQGLIATGIKPYIVYKNIFKQSVKEYYVDSAVYLSIMALTLFLLEMIKNQLLSTVNWINFIGMVVVLTVVVNAIFFILLRKRTEFQYLKNIILKKKE
ncbi:polysaccharide biosynthesis protein [Marinilactibacillus sp. XAAS-LB27]|uniref:lipopolysaccharide biosynthesis protein n=1 Tax=Marinilactibacillus sp. XAAS-LB27 TaxID=3114538 RepID=UPI002E1700DB|nr:polysaccharide biosynthesis protein [Marinilactibacillus sp. XAAS-LB27]